MHKKINFVTPTAHDKRLTEQNLEVLCKNAFNTMFRTKFGAHNKKFGVLAQFK